MFLIHSVEKSENQYKQTEKHKTQLPALPSFRNNQSCECFGIYSLKFVSYNYTDVPINAYIGMYICVYKPTQIYHP